MFEFLLVFAAIILILLFLSAGSIGAAIIVLLILILIFPEQAEAASLTANQDWKAFYAIMICAIWCMIYWLLKPIGEIVISWFLPNGSSYANVQQWMGCYLCVMLLGCLFNLSLLGA